MASLAAASGQFGLLTNDFMTLLFTQSYKNHINHIRVCIGKIHSKLNATNDYNWNLVELDLEGS